LYYALPSFADHNMCAEQQQQQQQPPSQSHLPVECCHALQQAAELARLARNPPGWQQRWRQAAMQQLVNCEALRDG
jgi:hypothetical protein